MVSAPLPARRIMESLRNFTRAGIYGSGCLITGRWRAREGRSFHQFLRGERSLSAMPASAKDLAGRDVGLSAP